MTGNLQPLDQKFPIVTPDGRPTIYFIQWAQQKQIDISAGITAEQALAIIELYLADHQLQAGTGISISPSGNLSDAPTIAAEVQAILDEISTTQGSILFRGAADWEALAPGTSGQFLKTNGAGADPEWATGGGGGGGGRTQIAQLTSPTTGTFDFSSLDFSGYQRIEIDCHDLTFSTIGRPGITFKFGGTVTTNQVYGYSRTGASTGSSETETYSAAASAGLLDNTSSNWWVVTTGTESNAAFNGLVVIENPNSSLWKSFRFNGTTPQGNSGAASWCEGGGVIRDSGVLDGLQIISQNGTISGGTITIYGVS